MEGPSGVIALVLAETAAGGTWLLWLGSLWGRVKRGYFVLVGSVVAGCALLGTLAASGAVRSDDAGRLAVWLVAATEVLLGISLAAMVLRLDGAGRVLGLVAVPVSAASLVAFARIAGPS